MIVRVELTTEVKPGRMADVAQMQQANRIVERMAGVTGQLFIVAFGQNAFGGIRMYYDFPSNEAVGRFNDMVDVEWTALVGAVMSPDGPWVLPVSRQQLVQIV